MTSLVIVPRGRWRAPARAEAPIVRARRISRRLLQALCRGSTSRKHLPFALCFNPIYVDHCQRYDVSMCDVTKPLTSSRSTDSGCALDFDDIAIVCGQSYHDFSFFFFISLLTLMFLRRGTLCMISLRNCVKVSAHAQSFLASVFHH